MSIEEAMTEESVDIFMSKEVPTNEIGNQKDIFPVTEHVVDPLQKLRDITGDAPEPKAVV